MYDATRSSRSSVIAACLVPFAFTALPQAAAAQDAPPPLGIEEITVTAQKRAQRAQDIPLAITALGSETLENMGIDEFEDLTRAAPSLTISESNNNRNESPVSLRGIGTYSFSIGIESSVALVVDDVPVPRSGSFFNFLNDVERIEVLRGPQSTLFGKNASAGVINVVTKGPADELDAAVDAALTSDDEYRLYGAVSGMASDTFGLRVSGYYSDREGHIENLTTGEKHDGSESYGARIKAVWDVSDAVSTTFIAEYNESKANCCSAVWLEVAPTANLFGAIPPAVWLDPIVPGEDNRQVRQDTMPQSDSSDWATSLKFEIELGEHTLASITGYREWDYDWLIDLDASDMVVLNQGGPYQTEQLTQEFRLVSPSFDIVEYVVGLYYTDMENVRGFDRGPQFVASWDAGATSESTALFGQADWHLTEKLNLVTGLRLNREEFGATFRNNVSGAAFAPSDDDDAVLGKLALQYFPSEDLMLYGSFTQGYKAGGYDISSSFNQVSADNPVEAETADSYELGMKGTFLSDRLQLNLAAFTTEFDDFQAQGAVLNEATNLLEFRLDNVGKLETQGVEFDAVALLTDDLQVNFAAAFIDATIKEFRGANCYAGQTAAEGCDPVTNTQDLSGKPLNNSPDLKYTIGGEYVRELPGLNLSGFLNLSYVWQDDINFDLFQSPRSHQDAYGLLNLSAGVESEDGSWKVGLFMNNVLDERYFAGLTDMSAILFGGETARAQYTSRAAERYYGIRLQWNL